MGIRERLSDPKLAGLIQFVKFGIVGVSNTAISYGVDMLCYYVLFRTVTFAGAAEWLSGLGVSVTGDAVKIVLTSLLSFIISVSNSYFWNSRYVFRAGEKRTAAQHARAFLRTVLCYGVTGLLLAPALKVWLSAMAVPFWAASLGSLVVTIPLNFVLNKFWAFGERKPKEQA